VSAILCLLEREDQESTIACAVSSWGTVKASVKSGISYRHVNLQPYSVIASIGSEGLHKLFHHINRHKKYSHFCIF